MTREEAINLVKQVLPCLNIDEKIQEGFETLIPELTESEDERIRKAIISSVEEDSSVYEQDVSKEQMLAWLGRQKEQKPLYASGTAEPDYGICDDYIPAALHIAMARHGWYACHVGEEEMDVLERKKYVERNWSADKDNLTQEQKEQKPEIISISEMVSKYRSTDEYDDVNYKGKPVNCMIRAYKQGIHDTLLKLKEQKPAKWSEEDKQILNAAIDMVEKGNVFFTFENTKYKVSDWLKLLPERFNILSKQEWSKEDEEMLQLLISYFGFPKIPMKINTSDKVVDFKEIASWLKALRPVKQEWSDEDEKMVRFYEADYNNQIGDMSMKDVIDMRLKFKDWLVNRLKSLRPSWKPSEEQMEVFFKATPVNLMPDELGVYHSLYNDLQKLL